MIEEIIYNGRSYKRDTDSKDRSHRVYYRSTTRSPQGERLLHRQKWVDVNGPIPFMYIIHHIDGDPNNNKISNLGCVSERDHLRSRSNLHNNKKVTRVGA
jgi:hypothetical protein